MPDLTTDAKRGLLRNTLADLVKNERELPQIIVNGQVFSTDRALRQIIDRATPTQLEDILRGFNLNEHEHLERERRQADQDTYDQARARLAGPLSDEEQEEVDAGNERARLLAEEANTVESRLGRLETVLIEIRDALVKR